MMILFNLLLLVAVLLSLSAADAINKRSASSYAVVECYSAFPAAAFSEKMGGHNSNIRCQEVCRDKGYILSATKGDQCQCGNVYPKGHKVNDDQCNSRCRSWALCHGVQSCCGGPNAYSVSVVGNIDLAKQVLRRLSHAWQTNTQYRNYLKKSLNLPVLYHKPSYWWTSFNNAGWSTCPKGFYIIEMYRHNLKYPDVINSLEEVHCLAAPNYLQPGNIDQDCYDHDWTLHFNSRNWAHCGTGYYLTGLYRSGHPSLLHNIEKGRCCRPKSQVKKWGHCYNLDLGPAFNKRGWSKCASGYYMVGFYRRECDELFCLEQFKCCKMGKPNNGVSWIENPTLTIKVKDTSGNFKQCSMDAMDKTPASNTYKCKAMSDHKNMLVLQAALFTIEDKTSLNVAKPKPVEGFRPITCSAHPNPYRCTKAISTEISTETSLTVGTGFTVDVSVTAAVEIEAKFFGSGVKTTFGGSISKSSSFNTERSSSDIITATDNTDVSIEVPENTEIKINMLRTVENLEYKWKGVFRLLGRYSIKWKNGQENIQDVTTVLSGPKGEMYAFGHWKYPGTDVLRVIITDTYGEQLGSGCQHSTGRGKECNMKGKNSDEPLE